ncbi:NERD domain-containing protein [Halorubrum sp. RMP-47]|uniref:NERD domain-containing protein n=1 Tax=Halorubrum miltondacostae TaxID=3076378 RepID=UPI00352792E9
MRFIPSSVKNTDIPGADAEAEVFHRLKTAFSGEQNGIGFYKFPVVDKAGERFEREPDFIILHKKYGLVVIEVKGYQINHIDEIIGQNWILQGTTQQESQPFSQAREQSLFLKSHFTRERSLLNERNQCLVSCNAVVALPNITQEEWEKAGHDTNPATRVLLADDLTPKSLRAELDSLPRANNLDIDVYRAARAVLTGGEVMGEGTRAATPDAETKREYYQQIEFGLKKFDKQQEDIGIGIPDGPQQIRGIAGSGKTVLLAMKAAAMHVKHPEWQIAITFNTRSLYDSIEELVDRFVAHFSEGKRDTNLEVIHAWGGRRDHGIYYKAAQEAGIKPRDVDSAQEEFGQKGPSDLLGDLCQEVIEKGNPRQSYDAIFIDEGQDFEPGFYKLCYEILSEEKRLIWAYDEAQNLTSLTAPTPSQIFDTDQKRLPDELKLTGSYEGGIQKSKVMRRSYRAPAPALMTAHTLGMGLKRPQLKIPRITTKKGWSDIGYEIEGDFREVGEEVKLRRPEEFSPHPLQDEAEAGPFTEFENFDTRGEEIEYVANQIRHDIETENLAPEEIMVIPLGSPNTSREIGKMLVGCLEQHGIEYNFAWEGNRSVFTRRGEVTVSRINRAKGNEAAQVYVLNLEAVERNEWNTNPVQNRNELFVALTRTRGWCTVTGTGETESVFDELRETIEETQQEDTMVRFPAPPQRDIDINESGDLPSAQTELDAYTENTRDHGQTVGTGGRSVSCPVSGCAYSAAPSSVAAHISGKFDNKHSWEELSYADASEFKRQHR